MTQRTKAGLLGCSVIVVGLLSLWFIPTNYVIFEPGPTINVLGKVNGEDVIEVSGGKTYEDANGGLRLVTIYPSAQDARITLPQVLAAWIDPDDAVYPYDSIYDETDTRESVRAEDAALMASSQEIAVAIALKPTGVEVPTRVLVNGVDETGPSAGILENGDRFISVDGKRVVDAEGLIDTIKKTKPGTELSLVVRRDGKKLTKKIVTVAAEDAPDESKIRVGVGVEYSKLPVKVDYGISERIGGPSGGMIFALGIYDYLTPGPLLDGNDIAGTGSISAFGSIGPIGGVQQKIAAARDAGSSLFLVPAANCAEAAAGDFDPDEIRLVRVETFDDALASVQSWVEDPSATLPECQP